MYELLPVLTVRKNRIREMRNELYEEELSFVEKKVSTYRSGETENPYNAKEENDEISPRQRLYYPLSSRSRSLSHNYRTLDIQWGNSTTKSWGINRLVDELKDQKAPRSTAHDVRN